MLFSFLKEFAAKEKLEIVGPTFVETKTAKEPDKNIGSNHILIFGEENFFIRILGTETRKFLFSFD